MVHCEFCGEEIGYLPFKCKYCGHIYCKEHRLPENHECTFELKHVPVVPVNNRAKSRYQEVALSDYQEEPKGLKRFMKRQKKRSNANFQKSILGISQTNGTKFLVISIFIMSIVTFALAIGGLGEILALSSYSFLDFWLWTFFTSIFVSYSSDFFGLFFLFILFFFFYNIIKFIELRFGTSFLLKLYVFCALFTALTYFLIWFPLYTLLGLTQVIPYGLASGALLGVISFMIYFNMDREMTFLALFIPIRLRGKWIIWFLILLRLIPGLILAIFNPLYLLLYLPDLGGILASYLIFTYKFKYSY
ncbi:MAG: AN1-like Zinc finger [Promethearchaeota archaeon]|nr:MAG: AN1-like Zinc finger [Candidatus Lokiarchaeota archaeon]